MELFFEEEGSGTLLLECEPLARQVIETTLDCEGCPYETEAELLLTDNQGIKELNARFRNIDRATDVLSFPLLDFIEPGSFEWLETAVTCFNPETGALPLGNIVISKEKVLEQANAYGHTPKREFAFLIVHSVLHLLGYDHITGDQQILMEARQRAVLEKLEILR